MAEGTTYPSLPPTLALLSSVEPGELTFANEDRDHVTFVGRAERPQVGGGGLQDVRRGAGRASHARAVGPDTRLGDAVRALPAPDSVPELKRGCSSARGFAGFLFKSLARQYTCAAFDFGMQVLFGVEAVYAPPGGGGAGAGACALARLVGDFTGFPRRASMDESFRRAFARMALDPAMGSSLSTTRFVYRERHVDANVPAHRTTVTFDKNRRITWRPSGSDSSTSPLPLPNSPEA